MLELTRRRIAQVSKHLDIGSSSGALLEVFQRGYGCEGLGVEPGKAYRSWSIDRGIKTYSNLEEIPFVFRTGFDVVSMIHVLEHLIDPVRVLAEIRDDWLAPPGYLLLEVPNLFGHPSTEIAHLYLFSERSLRNALRVAGFDVVYSKIHGQPRSPLLPLYITVIARRAPKLEPRLLGKGGMAGLRLRRRAALLRLEGLTKLMPGLAWKGLPALECGDDT